MGISIKGMAVALGLILAILFAALALVALYLGVGKEVIALLAPVYVGYSASAIGAGVGALWGFVQGFILGIIFAVVYNLFS